MYLDSKIEFFDKDKGYYYDFIDKAGEMVIDSKFKFASNFREGLAVVGIKDGSDTKAGFIDKSGNFIIQPSKVGYDSFYQGLAMVRISDQADPFGITKMKYINRAGEYIWDSEHIPESALAQITNIQIKGSDLKDRAICNQDVIVITPTIKDLEKAAIFSLENNCDNIGSDINFWNNKMDKETKDMLLNTLKKYGILLPESQKFNEQRDNDVEARICFEDIEEGLICAPVKLAKDASGNWKFSSL